MRYIGKKLQFFLMEFLILFAAGAFNFQVVGSPNPYYYEHSNKIDKGKQQHIIQKIGPTGCPYRGVNSNGYGCHIAIAPNHIGARCFHFEDIFASPQVSEGNTVLCSNVYPLLIGTFKDIGILDFWVCIVVHAHKFNGEYCLVVF